MKKLPQFAKFTISSIISACADFLVFALVMFAIRRGQTSAIVIATIIARIISTIINFIINKLWCFESKAKSKVQAGREISLFTILFVAKLSASAALVATFAFIKIPTVVLKMIVDTLLFFVSFAVQKLFIFN